MTTKAAHCCFDYAVVTPAQHGVADARRDSHGALHHLKLPARVDATSFSSVLKEQPCPAFKIAVNGRLDQRGADAFPEVNSQPHSVRQRWGDHPVEYRSPAKPITDKAKVREPTPPVLEAIGVLNGVPELLGPNSKIENASIVDDTRGDCQSMLTIAAGPMTLPDNGVFDWRLAVQIS